MNNVDRPPGLPDFKDPPVVETVLSAQFEGLGALRAAHVGLFWSQIRERYPKTEERGTLDPIVEKFPAPLDRRLGISLQSSAHPPMPRFWFISEDGNSLIQIQTDRFIHNWKKVGEDDSYPRYEKLRRDFENDFNAFRTFVEDNNLGSVRVNQCEVTYVNHIVAGETWDDHSEYNAVFTGIQLPSDEFPGQAEDLVLRARFPIGSGRDDPFGRLHVDIEPAVRSSDRKPMYVFNLTARGFCGNDLNFFDIGRDRIVRSFASMTTPAMHEVWKRRS